MSTQPRAGEGGLLLAGDIGGTKTDLAIYSPAQGPWAPLAQAQFPSAAYPDLTTLARTFLAQAQLPVARACFDVAGPVVAGQAKITNLPWTVEATRLQEDLNLARVDLLNDLEAIGWAVPALRPDDLRTLAAGVPVPGGARAVLAPGTGLGAAFLLWDGAGYRAYASEGGHVDFAPTDAVQLGLLRYLQQRRDHVSYEHVCSGLGIPHLYAYLRESGTASTAPALAAQIAAAPDPTPLIAAAALAPTPDPLCAATIDLFVAILGAAAGNLALTTLATGGVYLAGGIPIHIAPALTRGSFLRAFVRKGRFAALLERMPVHVITARAALLGAALYGLRATGAVGESNSIPA